MKKVFIMFSLLLFTFFKIKIEATTTTFNIEEDKVIVSGETIGINLDLGVVITGTYGIKENNKVVKPWQNILKEGDKIISYNNKQINSLNDLQKELLLTNGKETVIEYLRNNEIYEANIKPAKKSDDTYSLGLYIKDKVMGVGTLTFVVPNLNLYAALGHSIKAEDFSNGSVNKAEVIRIKKAKENQVGEKHAVIKSETIGTINKNIETGIYGKIYDYRSVNQNYMKVAKKEEIEIGKAYILTTIEKDKVEKFEVEIIKKYNQKEKDIKSMKIKITDQNLIEKTGGIIQGMSGSPIIQNDKLIGCLTHVIISNPLEGYGIYIEWMMEDIGLTLK